MYDSVRYSGVELVIVEHHKHLGFILDSKLNYTEHIDAKIAKANRGIGIIKRLYHYLPREALMTIYNSHIRPHLDSVMFSIINPHMMTFIVTIILNVLRSILLMSMKNLQIRLSVCNIMQH